MESFARAQDCQLIWKTMFDCEILRHNNRFKRWTVEISSLGLAEDQYDRHSETFWSAAVSENYSFWISRIPMLDSLLENCNTALNLGGRSGDTLQQNSRIYTLGFPSVNGWQSVSMGCKILPLHPFPSAELTGFGSCMSYLIEQKMCLLITRFWWLILFEITVTMFKQSSDCFKLMGLCKSHD